MRSLVLIALVVVLVNARPNGAPPPACELLKPLHYEVPEDSDTPLYKPQEGFPFDFVPQGKKVANGREVQVVSLQPTAEGPETFKGFAMRIESLEGEPLGIFNPAPEGGDTRNIKCEDDLAYLEKATITHTKNDTKTAVTLEWDNDGVNPEDGYVLRVSVVEKYDTWWHLVLESPAQPSSFFLI